jgi:putative flippase GtrA
VSIKNKQQKLRFILVGICNTTIDFTLLFTLKALGLPVIPANVISTTAAFCFSFFANKKYTFKNTESNLKRQVPLFIVVTLSGLWGVQTLIIFIISALLASSGLQEGVILLIAKIIATFASLIWNYTFYSRFVFKSTLQEK